MNASLTFLKPHGWNETHSDRLHKGLCSRFRFSYSSTNETEESIKINFTVGNNKGIKDSISDYFNGFCAAIGA